MKSPFLLLLVIALLLVRCTTGETALKKGRLDLAIKQSSYRLTKQPSHTKAAKVFIAAYQAQERIHQENIQLQIKNNQPFKWEDVLYQYQRLQQNFQQFSQCAACRSLIQPMPRPYTESIEQVRDLAAAERYEAGVLAFKQQGNRQACKEALTHFKKVKQLRSSYKDVDKLLPLAKEYATLRVVIEPFKDVHSLSQNDYKYLEDKLADALFDSRQPHELVRFYPPALARYDSIPPHHLIQLSFTKYSSQSETLSSSCTTVESNETYKVGTKKINDTTEVDVMEKVKGSLTTHRRELSASCRLEFRIIDLDTERPLHSDYINDSADWAEEWHEFSGDTRALNGKVLTTSKNLFPPSDNDFFQDMSKSLASRLRKRLQDFYQKE